MNLLSPILGDTPAAVLLSALLIVAAGWLLGKILRLVLVVIRARVAKRTRTTLDDELLRVGVQMMTGLVTLAAFYWAMRGIAYEFRGATVFVAKLLLGVNAASYVVLVLYAVVLVSRLVDAVIIWYMRDVAARTETRLDEELAPLVNRILNILVFAVGIVVILDHFHQNISTLVVSLGVGSLAIALAAQETLANMIAGFVLMIDRPFRPGDRIRLPDGTIGNVNEIGIRSTKVIDDNQVMIITPNAEIVKSQIKNFSYPNDIVRFQVPFGVAYGTDIERMRAAVVDRINAEPDIVDRETTEIRIVELGDSAVNAEASVYVKNPGVIPRRKSDLTALIYNTLREHGIEIPFPQRVVHLMRENADADTSPDDAHAGRT